MWFIGAFSFSFVLGSFSHFPPPFPRLCYFFSTDLTWTLQSQRCPSYKLTTALVVAGSHDANSNNTVKYVLSLGCQVLDRSTFQRFEDVGVKAIRLIEFEASGYSSKIHHLCPGDVLTRLPGFFLIINIQPHSCKRKNERSQYALKPSTIF